MFRSIISALFFNSSHTRHFTINKYSSDAFCICPCKLLPHCICIVNSTYLPGSLQDPSLESLSSSMLPASTAGDSKYLWTVC